VLHIKEKRALVAASILLAVAGISLLTSAVFRFKAVALERETPKIEYIYVEK